MAWTIKWAPAALKNIKKLDKKAQKDIKRYVDARIDNSIDPRAYGQAMLGNMSGLWRYRVGDYRIICRIEDHIMVVLVVDAGHRKDVYE